MALVAATALAATPASAGSAEKRKVKVGDDYFTPAKLTVDRGTVVRWRWLKSNYNTHDVKLKKRPKDVKRFQSDPAKSRFTFRRKLRKAGTYRIICTYHRFTMRQKIVVK
jgi:plastocyanin